MKLSTVSSGDDYITRTFSPETITRAIPEEEETFGCLVELRRANEELRAQGAFKANGMRHVATLPRTMLAAWLADDPEVLQSKRAFWKRADKHPRILTYRREQK